MLKLALVGACVLAVASAARADLVLNEVLYDPDGADDAERRIVAIENERAATLTSAA